jgi:hypothetical protein
LDRRNKKYHLAIEPMKASRELYANNIKRRQQHAARKVAPYQLGMIAKLMAYQKDFMSRIGVKNKRKAIRNVFPGLTKEARNIRKQ